MFVVCTCFVYFSNRVDDENASYLQHAGKEQIFKIIALEFDPLLEFSIDSVDMITIFCCGLHNKCIDSLVVRFFHLRSSYIDVIGEEFVGLLFGFCNFAIKLYGRCENLGD